MENEPFENISKALDVRFEPTSEIQAKREAFKHIKRDREEVLANDFNHARDNIKELIETGKQAVDGIMKVAIESDSPRAYEVASLLIKTISELNKDLMVVHEKSENIQKEKVTNITNNSIYVGSTTDLQNLINKARSNQKEPDELTSE
jgi:hypothetical protein